MAEKLQLLSILESINMEHAPIAFVRSTRQRTKLHYVGKIQIAFPLLKSNRIVRHISNRHASSKKLWLGTVRNATPNLIASLF